MITSSTTFSASGMNCAHCISAVTCMVQQVNAGVNAQVDLDKQTIVVTSDASTDTVKAAIE